jgi:Predicted membrane protein
MWLIYALLAAVFASLTAILAKVGLEGINSHLATAIRTAVVLALLLSGSAIGSGLQSGTHRQIKRGADYWPGRYFSSY